MIMEKTGSPRGETANNKKKEETSWTVEVVPAHQQAEVKRTYKLSVRFL